MKQFSIVRRSRPLLGTFVEISVYAEKHNATHEIIDQTFQFITRLESIFSFYQKNSVVSVLNSCSPGTQLKVPRELYLLLKLCQKFSAYSEGIFDITVPQTLYSDHEGNSVNWRDIILCPDYNVCFRKPIQIDLGGIAKGFIVDKAIKFLQKNGISNVLLNAGGDLRMIGDYSWPLVIRHPLEIHRYISLSSQKNISVSSSSVTEESYLRGGKSMAVVHPDIVTKKSDHNIIHATIISNCCTTADALTTIYLLNPTIGTMLIQNTASQVLICDEKGQWFTTENSNGNFYDQETTKIANIF